MDKSSNKVKSKIVLACLFILTSLAACKEKSTPLVPKPSSYLRTDLPDHKYFKTKVNNPVISYALELPTLFTIAKNLSDSIYGFQEIDLGAANGSLLLYAKKFNSRDSLRSLINSTNDLVDEHKVKADQIDFLQIKNSQDRVFGTFFALKGNVATNYQFYLTDSTSRFIRGELLLNCRPNYDSLRPVIEYLRVDLDQMIKTFRWIK
jgi:gliding motility-associated lipoprotein GldD